ncbi:MAG: DUF11 domain-containing protein, partial [Bacteroidales bacterium]|nr:DUF11 domain-containing protein [Bacteroidales bacterium]
SQTWTANYTDACGNTAEPVIVTFTWTQDTEAPQLTGTLPGGSMGNLCLENVIPAPALTDIAAQYSDNCSIVNAELTDTNITGDNCAWTVVYTYAVEDACQNQTIATVTFTGGDTQPPSITCPSDQIRDLSPNATQYTVNGTEFDYESTSDNCSTVTVTNNLNGTNSLDNYVFELGETAVTWTAVDECGNESSCTFIVFIYSTSFRITKTATERNYDEVGDIIHYTINVDNTGNVSVSDITVTDPGADPGSILYVSGDNDGDLVLDHNENWTYSASHTITQADLDAGHYENTVVVTGTPASGILDPAGDSEDVPAVQLPAISTDKILVSYSDNDGSGSVTVNDVLTYSVTVTNIGNITLHNITVTDPLLSPNSTSCATLTPGEACILTGTYTVTQANVDAGEIINTATGDSDETDPVDDTETVTIERTYSIATDKMMAANADNDGSGSVTVNDVLTYSVTVTNTGNTTINNVTVTDPLLIPNSTFCATLPPGGVCVLTGIYTVTQADVDAGEIVNTAIGDSDETDPVDDTEIVTIERIPAMTVEKVVDITEISAPATLTYTITVTNTGNVSLTNVFLSDDLAGTATLTSGDDGDGVLEVGEAWVYTATYAATQADIDAGTDLVNTASVTTTEIPVAVTDDATTTIASNPAMTVEKVVDIAEINAPGTLTYAIVVV